MQLCSCGNAAVEAGAECARCIALRTLGLQTDAEDEEIRSAYHLLVKVWHPDRFQHDPALIEDANEKLKWINMAFRYLMSKAGREARREAPPADPASSEEQPAPEPQHSWEPYRSTETKPSPEPQPSPVRARSDSPFWVSLLKAIPFFSIVMTCVAAAALLFIGWIVFKPIDVFLSSQPHIAGPYQQAKSEVWSGLVGIGVKISDGAGDLLHGVAPRKDVPPPPAAPQPEPGETAAQKTIKGQSGSPYTEKIEVLPYVTAGLSKNEVIAIQGPPTSTSENKLIYGRSELDFTGDRLVGWKIDAASPHIRVKLWPDAPVDPDLDYFWVGSSKNEVLVVQGTPTMWSENTFGYGRSEVYFKDGRVVSWKNDPATVPLRARPR